MSYELTPTPDHNLMAWRSRPLLDPLAGIRPETGRSEKPVNLLPRQIGWSVRDGLSMNGKSRGRNPNSLFSGALTIGLGMLLCVSRSHAAATPIPHGTLELIAEQQSISAGQKLSLGLHFQLEKGWHIYWVNPGDSGEPPRVKWRLPAGLTAGALEWPTPHRLGSSTIVDFGYEDAVTLIVPVTADASLPTQGPAQIAAAVKVLVCREVCIPGAAQLSLTLPIQSQPRASDPRTLDLFMAARKSLPRPVPANWKLSVADAKDAFVLTVNLGHQITQATFFASAESQIANAAPQDFVPGPAGFRLTLRKSDQLLQPIDRLKGVLVLSANQAYLIAVSVSKLAAAKNIDGMGIHPVNSLKEGLRK